MKTDKILLGALCGALAAFVIENPKILDNIKISTKKEKKCKKKL